jgi:hypothetical protein
MLSLNKQWPIALFVLLIETPAPSEPISSGAKGRTTSRESMPRTRRRDPLRQSDSAARALWRSRERRRCG